MAEIEDRETPVVTVVHEEDEAPLDHVGADLEDVDRSQIPAESQYSYEQWEALREWRASDG